MNFKETEKKIKDYYESLNILEGLKYKLKIYEQRKKELENKINNSIIKLNGNLKAVNYDGIGVSTNTKTSPQEKAIDRAFIILEKNLEDINSEIALIEEQISNIELKNSDMTFILKGIKPEYEKIMEYIYKNKNGTLRASMELNMDRATIYRKKDKVIREIMKLVNFYNYFYN